MACLCNVKREDIDWTVALADHSLSLLRMSYSPSSGDTSVLFFEGQEKIQNI